MGLFLFYASLAQLVERQFCKLDVAGSNPARGSSMKGEELEKLCKEVLEAYPDKVSDYKRGLTALIGLFTGEVMKRSKGLADPKETVSTLNRLLEK